MSDEEVRSVIRKYSSSSIDFLEKLVSNSAKEPPVLAAIREELRYRSSTRAVRLIRVVEAALNGQLVVNATPRRASRGPAAPSILGGRPREHESRRDVIDSAQNGILSTSGERDRWKNLPAQQILKLRSSAAVELTKLEKSYYQVSSSYQSISSAIADLKTELLVHMNSLLPGYFPIDGQKLEEMSSLQRAQFDRLREQAYQRWEGREELQEAQEELNEANKELNAALQVLDRKKSELEELTAFIENNKSMLDAELENDFVRYIAERMKTGVEDIDLIPEIRNGNFQPLEILSRARLFLTNVLKS